MNNKEKLRNDFEKIVKNMKFKTYWVKVKLQKKKFKDLSVIPSYAKKDGNGYIVYINLKTGEVVYKKPNSTNIINTTYYNFCSVMNVKYDKKYDAIQIVKELYQIGKFWYSNNGDITCVNEVNQTTIKRDGLYVYYIFKDKSVYGTELNSSIADHMDIVKKIPHWNIEIDYLNTYTLFGNMNIDKDNIFKIFSNFFGVGFIKGNQYTNFNNIEDVAKFLKAKNIVKKNGPKQNKIDELVKNKLKDVDIEFNDLSKLVCVANRVNSEYAVLRYFAAMYNGAPYEISRLYVSKNEYLFARKDSNGEFVYLANKLTAEHFKSENMILESKEVFDGTMLEYFKDICNELNNDEKGTAMYVLTTQPLFERLYKAGLKPMCLDYIKNRNKMLWETYLNEMYSHIDLTQKNINKMLGFNKHQLEKINTKPGYISYKSGIGTEMKELFNKDSLVDMDNETFDLFFDYAIENSKSESWWNEWWYIKNAITNTINTYSIKVCINMLPLFKKHKSDIIQAIRRTWGNEYYCRQNALAVYTDYVETVRLLNESSEMRPYFDNLEDLQRMHDDALIAYNMQEDTIKSEAFTKRSDFWKKWEYSENDNFIAIAPTLPADLAVEGITLHHCVKSYIERVADGKTNIMFIRKKEEPTIPFFTVEVSNNGNIEQVHGFANRNADTEPGLTKFVKEWAKKRKLKLTNFNKVR